MKRRITSLLAVPVVALSLALGTSQAAQGAGNPGPGTVLPGQIQGKPSKVVVIVVDALSREIVEKYGMRNVQRIMADGVNAPNAYLGHLGSVTVTTHNVITSGQLPKHMGWTDEGYRDVDGVLGTPGAFWITSNMSGDQLMALQDHAGYPKLADYLHVARPGSTVYTISPKGYAGYAFGGSGSDSIVTFGSKVTCPDGQTYRSVSGVNVPSYLSEPCGRFYVHQLGAGAYGTDVWPASLYPLDGDRYVTGEDPDHPGGDVWATDAALEIMRRDGRWSGITVTLPGVDKAAHMWGSVDDKGGAVPMTHLPEAARTADAQIGRIVDYLRVTRQLDDTLVVITADHGSVPGRNFYGTHDESLDYGYYNWYYGDTSNGTYLQPQAALAPLVATGNVGISYSDSMLRAWLKNTAPGKVRQAANAMAGMPKVTAVWVRQGDRYQMVSGPNWGVMRTQGERTWFRQHAQELVNTSAAAYGPDVIATLADDTTYSIAGDHGGIQRRSQQIPIVFYGGGLSSMDTRAPIRSVDILPTILRTMGIPVMSRLDGKGYPLPTAKVRPNVWASGGAAN